ncbi:hypothetical protein B0H12DRAFT_1219800 [Mycena haematopus]|nr:hypothetical protein B0H12DRAFT_1219800 [Mycena haematopus]
MSSRRLSLHLSALSDAEHALFTASLADLADIDPADPALDWDRVSVSVREARAWLCGRYASIGSGVIDEILRLFPAPTLSGGAVFALLRLVLHTQHAGRPVDRSFAFVQAPVSPTPIPRAAFNPFLPTPAPSPEARSRFPKSSTSSESSTGTSSSMRTFSSSSSSDSVRKTHGYSASISATSPNPTPPTLPLRRASSIQQRTSPPASLTSRPQSNPFRAPPLPPRRASTSTSPSVATPASPFASNAANYAPPTRPAPRTAPPTRTVFAHAPAPPLQTDSQTVEFNATVLPPTPSSAPPSRFSSSSSSPFYAPASVNANFSPYSSAQGPPVHPHRRPTSESASSTFERVYGDAPSISTRTHPQNPHPQNYNSAPPPPAPARRNSADPRRAASDSAAPPSKRDSLPLTAPKHDGGGGGTGALPLTLPPPISKALRRTLAGAGWVSAERGEREGLVRRGEDEGEWGPL